MKTYIVQKLEPLPDLDQDLVRDRVFFLRKVNVEKESVGFRCIHHDDIGHSLSGNAYVKSLFPQARTTALLALRVAAAAAEENTDMDLVFLLLHLFEELPHARGHHGALFSR